MNKKMMAMIMSALMVMAAFVIVVAAPSDAATGTGTETDPKYIIGTETTPVVVYNGEELKATIEFNRSAFTDSAVVSYGYEKIDGIENPLDTGEIEIDSSVETTGKGFVKVVTNFTPYTAHGMIIVKVQDTVTVPGVTDPVPLPLQKFYYAVNIDVRSSDTINLAEDGGALVWDDTNKIYTDTFNFEKDVKITASAKDAAGGTSAVAYKYYATNLPTGLSMKVDGKIGGKISNTYTGGQTGDATVYGVSPTGTIIKTTLRWTIGTLPAVGDFTMKATKDDTGATKDLVDDDYIAIETGFESVLTITPNTGFTAVQTKVLGYGGLEITETGGTYKITNDGTGTFQVKVSVDLKNTTEPSRTTTVTKTFTVYVVGKIVDADLDPAVVSV